MPDSLNCASKTQSKGNKLTACLLHERNTWNSCTVNIQDLDTSSKPAKMPTSLLAAQAPESGQKVHLHPLVLLTASDLITRHRLRELEGPVVGLLLGQQQGTVVTAEYAFTAKLKDGLLDQASGWTEKRIEQCEQRDSPCGLTY